MPLTESSLPGSETRLNLEAPGDFLSGLLAVCEASVLCLEAPGVREMPEAHGFWRVFAPQHGEIRITLPDRTWTLKSGQACAIPGGEVFSFLSQEGCTLLHFLLRGSAADSVFFACRDSSGLLFANGGAAAERMMRVLSAYRQQIPARDASEQGYSLLMALLGDSGSASPHFRKLPPVIEAAIGIIRREYAFLDGIAELSERLEVSQEYLTRAFRRYIGVTPGKYLNQVRIENAKLLLGQGDHTVQFVSDACGFANANYFARVFRASAGMTPREYAQTHVLLTESTTKDDALYVF